MKRLEKAYSKQIEELLYELHYDKKMTFEQIAQELLVSRGTVHYWMKLASITPMSLKERRYEENSNADEC